MNSARWHRGIKSADLEDKFLFKSFATLRTA